MSRTHARKKKSSGPRSPRTTDGAVYIGLLMIGAFVVLLAIPLTQALYWKHTAWIWLALMALLVNLYTFRAYLGSKLAPWQKALARLPLRCAGYGTRRGKPLEAAHGRPEARLALLGSLAVSLVLLAAAAALVMVEF